MSFGKKIGTRASFARILANYILEESLITADCDEKYNSSNFSFMKVSGAGKAPNDRRFVHLIYRVSDVSARAKSLHNLIHKASINESISCFFDILIVCLDIGI